MTSLLAAGAVPVSDLLDVFETYDGGVIFRGLAGQAGLFGRIGWIFTGFGAFFALWGFVLRSRGAGGGDKLGEIARTWMVIGFMVAGPFLMRAAMEAADGIYDSAVGGPRNLTYACVKAAYAMPELTSLFDALRRNALAGQPAPGGSQRTELINDANDGSVLGYLEAFGVAVWDTTVDYGTKAADTWNGLMRTFALLSGFGAAMLKCLLIVATMLPLYLLLLGAAALLWFMEQLRFFLAVVGTMMLPLFIGLFSLPSGHPNRQAAQAYVMHMVSLALWPVAWAIGHTGTIVLYDALVSLIAGTSRVPDMLAVLQWDAVTSGAAVGQDQVRAIEAALGNWFMGNLAGLLGIVVGGIGFVVWVFVVSVFGPVFLHKMLATGALFMTQALSAAGRHAVHAGEIGLGAFPAVRSLATGGGPPASTASPGGNLADAPPGVGLPVTRPGWSGPAGGSTRDTLARAAARIRSGLG